MPPSFWGEAMASFIHVSNRVTTTSLQGSTPHEAFYRSKPDLSHLRIWGCTAYVLIQKDKQPLGSLGAHMEKCIFIGYAQGYKAGSSTIHSLNVPLFQSVLTLMNTFSCIKDILLPSCHPLVLNLFLSHPPLQSTFL